MSEVPTTPSERNRMETWGLSHLFRIARLAVRFDALAIGLGAVVATFLFGMILNVCSRVGGGVSPDSIDVFIGAREANQAYEQPTGDYGVLSVFGDHATKCVVGLMGAVLPGRSLASGTNFGLYMQAESPARPFRHFADLGLGFLWLLRHHTVIGVFFCSGFLLIWSLGGGAICRIAALQFARDELIGWRQALVFSRQRLWEGFLLAPMVPIGLMLLLMLLLAGGGLVLGIPWIGDVVAGPGFFLAILGGLGVMALLVGLLIGGPLFWPAVACDGADGFDAFSRSLSYVFSRPLRTVFYAIVSFVYTAICFAVANLLTRFALSITRGVVALGTAPFGWGKREIGGASLSKMEVLWPMGGSESLYQSPQWSHLGTFEYLSAAMIALWVLLTIALVWAFLASLSFSSCTVVYFLLRRDVDGTDLGDVFEEDTAEETDKETAKESQKETALESASDDSTEERSHDGPATPSASVAPSAPDTPIAATDEPSKTETPEDATDAAPQSSEADDSKKANDATDQTDSSP